MRDINSPRNSSPFEAPVASTIASLAAVLALSTTPNTAKAAPAASEDPVACEPSTDASAPVCPPGPPAEKVSKSKLITEGLGYTEQPGTTLPKDQNVVVPPSNIQVNVDVPPSTVNVAVEGPSKDEMEAAARAGAAGAIKDDNNEKERQPIGRFVLTPQLNFNAAIARSDNATPSWSLPIGASAGYMPKKWGNHGVEFGVMAGPKRANMNFNPDNHRPKPFGYFELGGFGQYRDGAFVQPYWKAGLNYATGGTSPGLYADGGVVLQFNDNVGLLLGAGLNLVNYGPARLLQGDVENVEPERSIVTLNLRGRVGVVLRWDVFNKAGRKSRDEQKKKQQDGNAGSTDTASADEKKSGDEKTLARMQSFRSVRI